MATLILSGSAQRPADSILNLNKSTEPWHAQIATASSILGLNLDQAWKRILKEEQPVPHTTQIAVDPRVDWTLRWLVKKLKPDREECSKQCQDYKSWVLLHELVKRCPTATVAKHLRAYSFVNSLASTFQWMQDQTAERLKADPYYDGSGEGQEPSSSDTVTASAKRSSKKRKRDGLLVSSSKRYAHAMHIKGLFTSVCGAFRHILTLTNTFQGGLEDYAVEHLKHALKSSPNVLADIIGSAFYISNDLLQMPVRNSGLKDEDSPISSKIMESKSYKSCLVPLLDLWRRHAAWLHSTSNQTMSRAFVTRCVLPSLQLLQSCNDWQRDDKDMEHIISALKGLIKDHVLLPTRAKLSTGDYESIQDGEQIFPSLSTELVLALKSRPLAPKNPDIRADQKTTRHLQMSFLSQLFELAVKLYPRHNIKLARAEDRWLEALLLELDKTAMSCQFHESKGRVHKSHKRLLRWLLELSHTHKVRLQAETIKDILEKASGLFEDSGQIEWGIVNLCLVIDADVFVVPRCTGHDSSKTHRPPSKYLKTLLEAFANCPSQGDESNFVLKQALIPLLNAFVEARDLVGFMRHWREQLNTLQSNSEGNEQGNNGTIWIQEELFVAVSSYITRLTVPQIKSLVIETQSLNETSDDAPHKTANVYLGVIVVLDSVFSGCSRGLLRDDDHDEIMEQAHHTYKTLLDLLTTHETQDIPYSWRFWRTAISVTQSWPARSQSEKIQSLTLTAINRAVGLIEQIPKWRPDNKKISRNLTEHYHAFAFVLHFASTRGLFGNESLVSRQAEKVIETLIEAIEPLSRKVENDIWGTFYLPQDDRQMLLSFTEITSLDSLYVACMKVLFELPGALVSMNRKTQLRLIEQLYACALCHRRSPLTTLSTSSDYDWPWQELLRLLPQIDNQEICDCLTSFIAKRYLKVAHFEESKFWDIKAADYTLTFESLATLGLEHMSKGQRVLVVERVVPILTDASIGSIHSVQSHMVMLEKLIHSDLGEIPILTDLQPTVNNGTKNKVGDDMNLVLIAQNIDGKSPLSADGLQCTMIFAKISHLVLQHVISKLGSESTTLFVRAMYRWLKTLLEDHCKRKKACLPATSTLVRATLKALCGQSEDSMDIAISHGQDFQVLRQLHLETLLFHLSAESLPVMGPTVHHNLQSIVEYTDLLRIHPNIAGEQGIFQQLDKLTSWINQQQQCSDGERVSADEKRSVSNEDLALAMARLDIALCHGDDGLLPCLTDASTMLDRWYEKHAQSGVSSTKASYRFNVQSPKAIQALLASISTAIATLDRHQQAQFLDMILEKSANGGCDIGQLSLIRALILSEGSSTAGDDAEIRLALSRTITWLCQELERNQDQKQAVIAMQCIVAFLQRHPRFVTQWHIDSLLAAIAIASQHSESQLPERRSSTIYTGLCRLFVGILRTHRAKIGGRYHLVLPALQNLLRCLFAPYAHSATDSELSSAFTVQHAKEYTRILTMLCDPTVSSVTRSKKGPKADLNDETKKARSIAGQHLPYLIEEYCRCQLRGRLQPEMRSALNPGLWAVLEVMSKDRMRAMNAAMDPDSRSVFRALYEDFKKFGKCQGGLNRCMY